MGKLKALRSARRIRVRREEVFVDESVQVLRQRLLAKVHGKHCVQNVQSESLPNHGRDLAGGK